jgi:hypothetical protein
VGAPGGDLPWRLVCARAEQPANSSAAAKILQRNSLIFVPRKVYGTLTEALAVPINREPWSTTPKVRL